MVATISAYGLDIPLSSWEFSRLDRDGVIVNSATVETRHRSALGIGDPVSVRVPGEGLGTMYVVAREGRKLYLADKQRIPEVMELEI